MAIFDRSWYRNLLDAQVNDSLGAKDLQKAYSDAGPFERQMRDGGTVIFKFFLEVSKKEQATRLAALQSNLVTAWRVSDAVLQRHGKYKEYQAAVESMLQQTDLPDSPWLKVASKNTNQATLKVLSNLVSTLRKRVHEASRQVSPDPRPGLSKLPAFSNAPHLSKADLTSQLSKDSYR